MPISLFPETDTEIRREFRKRTIVRRAWEILRRRFKIKEAAGFTQADLARLIDKKPAQISRAFSSPRNMTLETFAELLDGLDAYATLDAVDDSGCGNSPVGSASVSTRYIMPGVAIQSNTTTGGSVVIRTLNQAEL